MHVKHLDVIKLLRYWPCINKDYKTNLKIIPLLQAMPPHEGKMDSGSQMTSNKLTFNF